ncbi:MAG TPA: Yip1 family protein [Chloroflexota bacterium]|nr:Yip1 family protein [Chloroflexota bacterium]
MDSKGLLGRIKAILLTPKTEWPAIAAEPATTAGIYTGYILLLAAVPAICYFLKLAVFGYGTFLGTFHIGTGFALSAAIRIYVSSIIGTMIVAFIVNALAPTFGGQKDGVQAHKVVAYSYTASWVAGIAILLGLLGSLIMLIGLVYGIYLLYLGLPPTMKCPPEKAGGYTLVTLICAILVYIVLFYILGMVLGLRSMGMGSMSMNGNQVTIDGGSAAGKLGQWAQGMAAAGKQLEAAQKSGDVQAQANAVGQMVNGAVNGGQQVDALPPDRLKSFLPDTLGGLKRSDVSAESNGAMGMQVATATATYGDSGGQSLKLEITDMGGAKGILAAATHANLQQDRETSTGYEKTYHQGDTMIHEQWDHSSNQGEYSAVVADRFMVKVEGHADNINALKSALGSVDMSSLAALRNEGVKSN